MPRLLVAGVMVLVSALSAAAEAQDLERARRLYLRARFEDAIQAFEAVLARPEMFVEEAVEAHRHLAVLHAVLGDVGEARLQAQVAVALDPAVAPPEGAPPEVEQLFATAREELGGRRAEVTIAADPFGRGDEVEVRATLDPAPPALASEISLRCESGRDSAEERGPPPSVELRVRAERDRIRCRAAAHTESGASLLTANTELEAGSDAERSVEASLEVDDEVDDDGDGRSPLPWILAGSGAAVLAGVIAAVVVTTRSDPDGARLRAPEVLGW
jgi:hypothetical protein